MIEDWGREGKEKKKKGALLISSLCIPSFKKDSKKCLFANLVYWHVDTVLIPTFPTPLSFSVHPDILV